MDPGTSGAAAAGRGDLDQGGLTPRCSRLAFPFSPRERLNEGVRGPLSLKRQTENPMRSCCASGIAVLCVLLISPALHGCSFANQPNTLEPSTPSAISLPIAWTSSPEPPTATPKPSSTLGPTATQTMVIPSANDGRFTAADGHRAAVGVSQGDLGLPAL